MGVLMLKISEAASRREIKIRAGAAPLGGAAPAPSMPRAVTAFHAEKPRLDLQPPFSPRGDDHYHVNDLLQYHDEFFVTNTYLALLKRPPDPAGCDDKLRALREGHCDKIDVLGAVKFSPEGKAKGTRVEGLAVPYALRRIGRLPLVGYLFQLVTMIGRLPVQARRQRQLESYVITRQQAIADYVNSYVREAAEERRVAEEEFSARLAQADERTQLLAEQNRKLDDLVRHLARLLDEQADASAKLLDASVRRVTSELRQTRAELRAEFKRAELLLCGAAHTAEPHSPSSTASRETIDTHALDTLHAAFQEEFRGSRASVKERLSVYLPFIEESGIKTGALDLGCGRGEWLELLGERGVVACGVDANTISVEACRARGLNVVEADALSYMPSVPDGSLRLVTMFHVAEHMTFGDLIEFTDGALRALCPGGMLILETPNPKNLVVGACNFYSDPTHQRPLFPETLDFILRHRGFVEIRTEYLNRISDNPFAGGDEASRVLSDWFFGARDFGIIARKP